MIAMKIRTFSISRGVRSMLLLLTSAILIAATGCRSVAPASCDYSVTVLGDIHYDDARFHTKEKPGCKPKQQMWKEESPALLAASAAIVGPDTAFALQLGDMVDGYAASYAAHTQMLAEASSILEKTYHGLPLVVVCGNHDVGPNAFKSFMIPWQAKHLASLTTNEVKSTTFGFRHGPDLWVVIDFNSSAGTVDKVAKIFEENPDVRYTFIAVHGPVLPMDVWKVRWFYLGQESTNMARRKMREMLAKRNAIVLSAHVHALEYKDWYGDSGRITEMVLSSVPRESSGKVKPAVPDVISETPDDYGAWLKTAEKTEANARFDALFDEYRPGLKARYAARAVGHHVLRVSDSGVVLEYYGGTATEPTKTFKLR